MTVKCEITNYLDNGKPLDTPKIIVQSVFAESGLAEIICENTKMKVGIEELISALEKCRLNYRGI